MTIEITGVQFVNKGAHLMLLAILDYLRPRYPSLCFSIVPRRYTTYRQYAPLGLYPKATGGFLGWRRLLARIPKAQSFYGLVTDGEIDAVLDAAGFALGDQRGEKKAKDTARTYRRLKRIGTKICLLPQAFGPFTSKEIRSSLKTVWENVDLICARDRVSYNHLVDVTGESERIRIAPDFTCLLSPEIPSSIAHDYRNHVCIIPNDKMTNRVRAEIAPRYLKFLSWLVKYTREQGYIPFLLVHEGKGDYQIAKETVMSTSTDTELVVIRDEDPLMLKAIIGSSYAVVSSRFHGAVNALCQGVPTLVTSWSHKYEMLLSEYGVRDGVISLADDEATWQCRVELLFDPQDNSEQRAVLRTNAAVQKSLCEQMWLEVCRVLGL